MSIIARVRQKEPLFWCLKALSVPKSSYYHCLFYPKQALVHKYKHLRKKIEKIIRGHSSYGYRKIQQALVRKGIVINHKPLKALLKAFNLQKVRRIKSPKPSPLAQYIKGLGGKANLLKRLTEINPLKVWLTDFTEVDCLFGKFQIILYSDVLTKRIGGSNGDKNKDTKNALKSYGKLKRYLKRMRIPLSQVLVHQDQDPVFTSYEYASTLLNDEIALSFTEKGFKDNQMMESCNSHFKTEYKSLIQQAKTLKEAKQILKGSVKDWNEKRIHASLKGRSPDEFIHTLNILRKS